MLDLALHGGQGPVSSRDIASRADVSAKYIEQLLAALKGAGLVNSVRGCAGGHVLAKPAAQITMYDIVRALEGVASSATTTGGGAACQVWEGLGQAVADYLEARTLAGLVEASMEGGTADKLVA